VVTAVACACGSIVIDSGLSNKDVFQH